MSKAIQKELPRVIQGDLVVDDRGQVAFVNAFRFKGVKRFYIVSNHKAGFVRAWHAHRREAKYISIAKGAALIGAVAIDNWKSPSKNVQVHRFVISENKPAAVYIPPGYANGFMSLTPDTKLIIFSTSTTEESQKDDVRFDAHYWDIWNIIER